MMPAARIAAAIELLDMIEAGSPAEKALTSWARKNRYAGAKDRAAIRDHVFDVLRNRLSYAHLGGGLSGRALMIGALRAQGQDPGALFTGQGYAPAPLSADEAAYIAPEPDETTRLDCPPWLAGELAGALGEDFAPVMERFKTRAPVFVRVNLARTTPEQAANALAQEGIVARPHPLAATALELVENPRRLRASAPWRDGLVELQDVASQAVCALIDAPEGARILDYCAGGGGKSLALAAREKFTLFAHDANAARLRDLPERARRAGTAIEILSPEKVQQGAPFDLVVADVPCSGSGTWRRAPGEKWRLTADKLDELCAVQAGILRESAGLLKQGGRLAYITCSLLERENEAQLAAFLANNPGWKLLLERRFSPLEGGDGFFVALLERE